MKSQIEVTAQRITFDENTIAKLAGRLPQKCDHLSTQLFSAGHSDAGDECATCFSTAADTGITLRTCHTVTTL